VQQVFSGQETHATAVWLLQLEQHVHGQKCCERKKERRDGTSIGPTPGSEYENPKMAVP
jgi:hypothetical protein